jgi:hypothetical protein
MANNSDGKITNTSRKKTIRDALGIVMLVVPVCSGVLREARQKEPPVADWQIEDRSATVVPR